jgi:nicotinamide-nucleotide amidase
MVEGALKNSRAELAVSCTGVAGPSGGTAEKPVGLVHIAVSRALPARIGNHDLDFGGGSAMEYRFGDIGRNQIRMKSVEAALHQLLGFL